MLLQIIKRAPLESGFRRRLWNINSRARAVSSCAARVEFIQSSQRSLWRERPRMMHTHTAKITFTWNTLFYSPLLYVSREHKGAAATFF
jgi:hypothetical protein